MNLSSNNIGDDGIRHLAKRIASNTTLTTFNYITMKEAKHLSTAIKTNSTITNLDLYHNRIKDKGAQYLADAIKSNS